MLDHIGLPVSDLARSRAFYEKALAPLGVGVVMEGPAEAGGFVGLGPPGKPVFWLTPGHAAPGVHLAFAAGSRAEVDAFHAAAIGAGGRDNGPPGLRPHYHPHYYAAFVFDPNGVNVEAVCHQPE